MNVHLTAARMLGQIVAFFGMCLWVVGIFFWGLSFLPAWVGLSLPALLFLTGFYLCLVKIVREEMSKQ